MCSLGIFSVAENYKCVLWKWILVFSYLMVCCFSYICLQEQYWFCYKIVLEVLQKLATLDLERLPHTWHTRGPGASSERAWQVVPKEGLCCVHNVLPWCIIWFPFRQLPEGPAFSLGWIVFTHWFYWDNIKIPSHIFQRNKSFLKQLQSIWLKGLQSPIKDVNYIY